MDEIKKIELKPTRNSQSELKESSAIMADKHKKPIFSKKATLIILPMLAVIGIIIFFGVFLPVQRTYGSASRTYLQAKKVWDAIKKQNVEEASVELAKTKKELAATQKDLSSFSYLRYIPIASGYYSDAEHLTKAGTYGLDALSILIDSVKPYTDILGLKGKGSFVMGTAEQRIQTAIMTMGKITPRIDDIAKSLNLARQEIDAVDPNHYPGFLGGDKIKVQLTKLKTMTDQGVIFVNDARPLIKVLPSLLGESKERKYLVLFQNDKELRPTGGFITAYAIFRIEKGIIHVDKSDDIYNLDNTIRKKYKVPDPIAKYLPKVTSFNLRDSNLSPDFIESMKTFETMYNDSSNKTKIDGIIAIDTNVLISTIKILDDEVIASGIKFNTKNDPRCDCPQVIYVLEDNISKPVNYEKSGRKDLLGSLLYATMEKALKSSPKLYWGPLFQEGFKLIDQKHVLFYLYDKDAQSGIEALNAAGKIKPFEGDYLHVNDTNFGGQKSNMYTTENVEQNYEVKGDGSIIKTITLRYKNPHEPSDCNLERGNLCLNATLRDWVRLYVPKGSVLLNSQGSEVKVTTYDELNKTVIDGFITVRPLGTATYTISYRLPFKLTDNSPLPVLIQKQPGTFDNEYVIKVNGREKQKFPLLTDKEVQLNLK